MPFRAGLVLALALWLPLAHPGAPSHVSALMSGGMTKVAIYGFIRIVFDLLGQEAAWWWSVSVLAAGGGTAVMGFFTRSCSTTSNANCSEQPLMVWLVRASYFSVGSHVAFKYWYRPQACHWLCLHSRGGSRHERHAFRPLAGGRSCRRGERGVQRAYDAAAMDFANMMALARKDAPPSPAILALIDKVESAEAAYPREIGDPVIRLTHDNPTSEQATELSNSDRAQCTFASLQKAVDETRADIDARSASAQKWQDQMISLAHLASASGGFTTLLLAVLIGWWLTRSIAHPVDEDDRRHEEIGGRRRHDRRAWGWPDELGRMAEAVQFFKEQAIKKLKKKAQEEEDIKRWQQEDAERLAREKEADGDLVYRIDTVFAPKTEKLRTDFNNAVEKLQQTMQGLRANIDAMHVGSGEISSAADDLSRRTEQPALNAGVEAVRAGDAGRGFAVVASEVRALAQRSAEAAKEIKGLISASTAQVTQGVDLVGATGKALGRIVERVAEIDKVVSGIAGSAQEQATALHQVNAALNQMDQVRKQNAAMVEETTAAAHMLNQESDELARLVGLSRLAARKAMMERSSAKQARASLKPRAMQPRGGALRKPEPALAQIARKKAGGNSDAGGASTGLSSAARDRIARCSRSQGRDTAYRRVSFYVGQTTRCRCLARGAAWRCTSRA